MKQHLLISIFLPTLLRINLCSIYLARLGDVHNNITKKMNTNMDSIVSIISQAERGNRSLTDEEEDMISNDYEDKCQCHCNVHVGDIINEVTSQDYSSGGPCNCLCRPCSGGNGGSGGGG